MKKILAVGMVLGILGCGSVEAQSRPPSTGVEDEVLAGLAGLPNDTEIRTEYDEVKISLIGDAGARVAMRFRRILGVCLTARTFRFGGTPRLAIASI